MDNTDELLLEATAINAVARAMLLSHRDMIFTGRDMQARRLIEAELKALYRDADQASPAGEDLPGVTEKPLNDSTAAALASYKVAAE